MNRFIETKEGALVNIDKIITVSVRCYNLGSDETIYIIRLDCNKDYYITQETHTKLKAYTL